MILLACGARADAGLFLLSASFSAAPSSQLGPATSTLVITNTASGFVVTGSVVVTLPATTTPIAGTLVQWTVDRPLDPSFGTATLTTTTIMSGTSSPPVGLFNPTNGSVSSEFSNVGAPSQSFIPLSLVNGIDSPSWASLSVTSSSFSYTSGVGNVLQQKFQLDGVYLAGPGGSWTISVPVTTIATLVPEPDSLTAGLTATVVAALWSWPRRWSRARRGEGTNRPALS